MVQPSAAMILISVYNDFSAHRWQPFDSLEGGKGLEVSPHEPDVPAREPDVLGRRG